MRVEFMVICRVQRVWMRVKFSFHTHFVVVVVGRDGVDRKYSRCSLFFYLAWLNYVLHSQ